MTGTCDTTKKNALSAELVCSGTLGAVGDKIMLLEQIAECSSLKEINRNRTNDTEWIKSGRSSGHAQTFLKLKLYKV